MLVKENGRSAGDPAFLSAYISYKKNSNGLSWDFRFETDWEFI